MSKTTISLITYCDLPRLDPDDILLKEALEKRGCEVRVLIWDEDHDWEKSGTCVLRSTWDYHRNYDRFCAWLQKVSLLTEIWNAPAQVLWNSRKTYLRELSEAGLPVIPTVFIDANHRPRLSALLHEFEWHEAVVKPSIGLATSGVKKIGRAAEETQSAENHISALLEKSEVMVQEFLPSVHGYGERALMFIDGEFSHCVRKSAFQKLAVAGEAGETAATATAEEIEVATRVLSHLSEVPLYARVDLVPGQDNKPLLMELELVEPSLFLKTHPQAAEKLADAILNRL